MLSGYDAAKGFKAIPEAIIWGAANFYPTAASFERLPSILDKLLETIFLSIAAATIAAALALVFAILGSNTTKIHTFFSV